MKIHRIYLHVTKKIKCFKLEMDVGIEERKGKIVWCMNI